MAYLRGIDISGSSGVSGSKAEFTQITGSSFTGSFTGDGSNLTGIDTDPFPYTGNAQINGGLGVSGSVGFIYDNITPAAWSTGGALIQIRRNLAGAGTQDAGLAFGGYYFSNLSCTEEYNGTSWSTGGALSTPRYYLAGAGTQNAGLAFGGGTPTLVSCTEEYDGSSWTAGGALIVERYRLAGAGTQNAGLAFGGLGFIGTSCTEEYNGTSWTAGGALITGKFDLGGAGTQNAGLAFGGYSNDGYTIVSCTEEYDGTSWTAGGALITARRDLAGAGTQNAALAFGGQTPTMVSCTEEYNGTSWAAGGALIIARYKLAGAGTQNAGLAFGGSPTTTSTEEYTGGFITPTKTFDYSDTTGEVSATGSFTGSFSGDGSNLTGVVNSTSASYIQFSNIDDSSTFTGTAQINGGLGVSGSVGFTYEATGGPNVWSLSGGPLIQPRNFLGGAGEQNAALAFAGSTNGGVEDSTCTEEYNGTSWSTGGALSQASRYLAGAGTQNAALAFGGEDSYNNILSCTEEYGGSSWSAGGALITGRDALAGAGTQDAAVAFGGGVSTPTFTTVSCTEEYNGTSWSTGGALIIAKQNLAGAGTQNAGLAFGGYPTSCTEEYDGTSWSAGGALIEARYNLAGAGTQNAALAFGGRFSYFSEEYDGTSWSAGAPLTSFKGGLAGAGTQNAALAFGGYFGYSTEEYNPGVITTKTFDYSDTTGEVSATGSFTGSFSGDGSNLTGIFPYTGSAIVSGSFNVIGPFTQGGDLLPSQHEAYDLGSPTLRWRDLYLSGSTIDLGGTKISRDSATGDIEFKDSNNNRKNLRVASLEIGEGDKKFKFRVDNSNKLSFYNVTDDRETTETESTIIASTASYIAGSGVDGAVQTALTASYIDPTFISSSAAAQGFGSGGGGGDAASAESSSYANTAATFTNVNGGNLMQLWVGTQIEYDALGTYDSSILYFIR